MLKLSDQHPYQQDITGFTYDNPYSIVLVPMGGGKTSAVGTTMTELIADGHANRFLVLAPKRVASLVWRQEFAKWEHLCNTGIVAAIGEAEERMDAFESSANIVVMNYENLSWMMETYGTEVWGRFGFDGLVMDEITKLKNASGIRFKSMSKYIRRFRASRIGMTGTFTPNGVKDIYGQMFMIDAGKRLGIGFNKFRAKYYEKLGPMEWQWQERPNALDDILDDIQDVIIQIPDSVYKDQLPPVVTVPIDVELPADARVIYDDMEEHFVSEVYGLDITAANAGVKTQKLQQIANGFLYVPTGVTETIDDDNANLVDVSLNEDDYEFYGGGDEIEEAVAKGRIAIPLHEAKLDALEEIIEGGQGATFMIAYKYRADLDMIRERLGKIPYIGSGVSDKIAEKWQRMWNAEALPLLAVHPASVAHGVNFQDGGCRIIWYGETWSQEERDQLIARLRRQGQRSNTVWSYHIGTIDTVDGDMVRAVEEKRDVSEAVEAGLRRRHKALRV